MAATLWHRFESVCTLRPAGVALRHGDSLVTFGDLLAQAAGWAALLGVAPGDRVVVCGANGAAMAAAVPGIWACGAIPVFVNADAPATHLAHAVRQTGAGVALTDAGVELAGVRALILGPVAAVAAPAVPQQTGQAPGSVVYTSGSTGLPKGVVQAAETLMGGADRVAQALGYRDDDMILCPIPFAFDYGWGQLLSLLLRGIPLVLPDPRNAFGICAALAAHRPTVLAGVPAVFADLTAGMAPIRETPRGSVRLITNTGSKIPASVSGAMRALFPDAALSLNYGLTETYRSATLPVALAASHAGSVGRALPGAAIAVLRPDGTEAAVGEAGEIVHRGAGVFLGYWGEPARSAQVRRPDPLWPHPDLPAPMAVFTGDLGHLDAEGLLYIHGRRDRQMKSMGVRVSPDEVEALLLESGLLAEAAVVSRANEMIGDLIVAVVCVAPGGDPAAVLKALKRHARAVMSPYMQPREYLVLPALPRNPNGKVDYPALKAMVLAGADQ